MSTNAIIKIEGITFAKVYKHFDGYPQGTLPFLVDFNKSFTEERGCDPEYKFAQLLRATVRKQKEFNLDPSQTTGWGVVPYSDECGEEYEYVLHKDGSVTYERL